jgi:hypothetical protein
MWKVVCVSCHYIIKQSYVMNRPRPPRKNKCEDHIKVTCSHHILGCLAISTKVLNKLVLWHH